MRYNEMLTLMAGTGSVLTQRNPNHLVEEIIIADPYLDDLRKKLDAVEAARRAVVEAGNQMKRDIVDAQRRVILNMRAETVRIVNESTLAIGKDWSL